MCILCKEESAWEEISSRDGNKVLTSNDVNLLPRVAFDEDVYTMLESDWIQQNGGDIIEQDTRLWEIMNFTNSLAYHFISRVRACHVKAP